MIRVFLCKSDKELLSDLTGIDYLLSLVKRRQKIHILKGKYNSWLKEHSIEYSFGCNNFDSSPIIEYYYDFENEQDATMFKLRFDL